MTSLEQQIQDEGASARYWGARADELSARAARMRYIAGRLTTEVDRTAGLFDPIRALHTAQTWEGNAATLSRQRLDTYEDQYVTAVRSINGLISDLHGEALTASQQATYAETNETQHRQNQRLLSLEREKLGSIQ